MTPKEKAEELFKQYYSYLKANLMDDREAWEDAKECALILVDEIIKVLVELSKEEFTFIYYVEYWQEVKQEIEKL